MGGGGADDLDGGGGNDTAVYSDSGAAVTVNLEDGTGLGGSAEGDTLEEIENVVGSDYDDGFQGDGGANQFRGGDGNDVAKGGGGADTLVGQDGEDSLYGMGGKDTLRGNGQNDYLSGGNGRDKLVGGSGADELDGGKHDDVLRGGDGSDLLDGGRGNDILTGDAGNDAFLFNDALDPATNVDAITDFAVNHDEIHLKQSIFSAIGNNLGAGEFRIGGNAQDGNDYIMYNKANGKLFYDADGDGAGDRVLFAKLDAGLNVDHNDFLIV